MLVSTWSTSQLIKRAGLLEDGFGAFQDDPSDASAALPPPYFVAAPHQDYSLPETGPLPATAAVPLPPTIAAKPTAIAAKPVIKPPAMTTSTPKAPLAGLGKVAELNPLLGFVSPKTPDQVSPEVLDEVSKPYQPLQSLKMSPNMGLGTGWQVPANLLINNALARQGYFRGATGPQLQNRQEAEGLMKVADLKPEVELRPYQAEAADAADKSENGQLFMWGLGSGKTLGSIAAAERIGKDANVVVPASLQQNYKKDITKFVDKPSLGSSGKYNIQSYNKTAKGETPYRPTLIADEVQQTREQGRQYKGLLDQAAHADKRILLSGTPLINGARDLANITNLLHGKQLFTPTEFEDRFVSTKVHKPFLGLFGRGRVETKINHRHQLEELLKGRVNYVSDQENKTKPSVSMNDVAVEMSPQQDKINKGLMGELPFWARFSVRHNLPPSKRHSANLNAFLSGVRQNADSSLPFDKRLDPYTAFQQSPKLTRSFSDMQKHLAERPTGKAMLFSNFVHSGLTPFAAALDKHQVPYSSFRGDMSESRRTKELNDFNNGKTRVLLVSPSGSAGISTKGVTHVALLDSHFNSARSVQALGRAVRADSHTMLPLSERHVDVYRYASEPRRSVLAKLLRRKPAVGVDQYLRSRSEDKDKEIEVFTDLLRQVGTQPTVG